MQAPALGGAVLSPIEAQRAVAVLEETIEKLTFLGRSVRVVRETHLRLRGLSFLSAGGRLGRRLDVSERARLGGER